VVAVVYKAVLAVQEGRLVQALLVVLGLTVLAVVVVVAPQVPIQELIPQEHQVAENLSLIVLVLLV
jgi:hypothetical protein